MVDYESQLPGGQMSYGYSSKMPPPKMTSTVSPPPKVMLGKGMQVSAFSQKTMDTEKQLNK